MKEIEVKGTQEFMGKEIPIVSGGFGINQKCISDKTIAELHNMKTYHIREAISKNKTRFMKNIDYIDLKQRLHEEHTLESNDKKGRNQITTSEITNINGLEKGIRQKDTSEIMTTENFCYTMPKNIVIDHTDDNLSKKDGNLITNNLSNKKGVGHTDPFNINDINGLEQRGNLITTLELPNKEINTIELLSQLGYTNMEIGKSQHIYLLSRRGYAKLIKIFDTDLAWEVYEKLLDEYFTLEQLKELPSVDEFNGFVKYVEKRLDALEDTMTIDYRQQNDLRRLGNHIIVNIVGGYDSKAYKVLARKLFAKLWNDYKEYFNIESYKNTPRKKYEEARNYIKTWYPDRNSLSLIQMLNSQN